jgi:hypothetical protein
MTYKVEIIFYDKSKIISDDINYISTIINTKLSCITRINIIEHHKIVAYYSSYELEQIMGRAIRKTS